MANIEDITQLLSPPHVNDLTTLAESALRSFPLLERWYQARECLHHPLVKSIINRIIEQADLYQRAIDLSLDTAQDGYNLADDAITLCETIAEGGTPTEHLASFVTGMLEIAEKAHERVTLTNSAFRDVRGGLLKIANDIPAHMKEILKSTKSAASRRDPSFVWLPSVLSFKEKLNNENERQIEDATVSAVVDLLHRATDDLQQIVDHVGTFVDWWASAKTRLTGLLTGIPLLRLDGSNPLRTETTSKSWERVRDQYAQYPLRIGAIRDYYRVLDSTRMTSLAAADQTAVTNKRQLNVGLPRRHMSLMSGLRHRASSHRLS